MSELLLLSDSSDRLYDQRTPHRGALPVPELNYRSLMRLSFLLPPTNSRSTPDKVFETAELFEYQVKEYGRIDGLDALRHTIADGGL